ncbi:MAG: hypothetical protein ACKV2T_40145 [Kofleriaceae bacterium]
MPTWDETKDYLRTKYKLMKDEPTWIGLGFGFKVGEREVLQSMRVIRCEVEGLPAIDISGDIVASDKVPHEKALQRNMAFAIGGIAIHKDNYVLRATVLLDGLALDALDKVLVSLAREAARLRDSLANN